MHSHERRHRIVIVDDDADFQSILKDWLAHRYDTVSLPSGLNLLEQLRVVKPDLVLLDVSLPGADGFTLCERIRAQPCFVSMPVLFLTCSSKNSDFVASLDAGGSAYMTKPVDRGALLGRIASLLSERPL